MTDPTPQEPAPPAGVDAGGGLEPLELLSFDVERLAAGRQEQLRCTGGFTVPLSLAEATLERGVSLGTLQAAFDALCALCQRSPTRVFARVSAAQVAAAADISVTRVNRAVPLLAAFGLIVRRPRHRGAWETTVPALVEAAAAGEGTLDRLWAQPAAEPGPPQWRVPAAVADAASWVRMDPAALEPQPTRSCPCRPRCDLGEIIEQLVAVIGPQARDRSWQDDLHAGLAAGFSAQFLLWELTRDMHDARSPAAVARTRLHGLLGRAKRRSRHACSDADQHAAAVSWHNQAVAALGAHQAASEATQGAPAQALATERAGFVRERDHVRRRGLAQGAAAKPAASLRAREATEPVPVAADPEAVEVDPAEYRETNRKDLNNDLLLRESPPQTPPHPTDDGGPNAETAASNFALSVTDEAAEILGERITGQVRLRCAGAVDRFVAGTSERERLAAVLGLVVGTQGAGSPWRLAMWRAWHPEDAARKASPFVALIEAGLGNTIRDPAGWLAAENHRVRVLQRQRGLAEQSQRRAEQLAEGADARARAAAAAVERDRDAGLEARAAAAQEALAQAERRLGRPLHPAVARTAPLAAGAELVLVVRRLVRVLSRIPGLEADAAALLVGSGRWENLPAELATLPAMVMPAELAERLSAAAGPLGGDGAGAPTVSAGSLSGVAAAGSSEDVRAFMAGLNPATVARSEIDAAITAAAANELLSAQARREIAAELVRWRQSATDTP